MKHQSDQHQWSTPLTTANFLTINSDENEFRFTLSLLTSSNNQVMRIKKVITKDKMSWYLDKKNNKCMKNSKEKLYAFLFQGLTLSLPRVPKIKIPDKSQISFCKIVKP